MSEMNQNTVDLYKTLQRNITNMSKSMTCPICQSTYTNPVLLPCVHAYCHDCISQALMHSPQCPTCKCKTTKRSLVESTVLAELARTFKSIVQDFGMAPIVFDDGFVGMTQNTSATELPDPHLLKLHYQVSKTWQRVLEENHEDASFANEALRQQQAAVVAIDEQMMEQANQYSDDESDDDDESMEHYKPRAHETSSADASPIVMESSPVAMKNDKTNESSTASNDSMHNGTNSNVDSQGNAFVDAKSQDDASVASDETTLDDTTTQVQDITTLLTNQNLIMATPAAARQETTTIASNPTCPRNNTTVNQEEEDALHNALTTRPHPSSPTLEVPPQSESQGFYTAESEAEDTQGDDDGSLTAAANKEQAPLLETIDEHGDDNRASAAAAAKPATRDDKAVPKQVTVHSPPTTTTNQESKDKETSSVDKAASEQNALPVNSEAGTVPPPVDTILETNDRHSNGTCNEAEPTDTKADEPTPDTTDAEIMETARSEPTITTEEISETLAQREPEELTSDGAAAELETSPHTTNKEEPPPRDDTAAQTRMDDEPMPDADESSETAGRDDEEEPMPDVESADERPEETEPTSTSDSAFAVGAIVQVEDRCWPGINKQGGVGRVTKVHRDDGVISYDVAYVLGGKEKKVEAVFVQEQELERKRSRSPKPVGKEKLSPELLASLAADGFDTEGKVSLDQVKRVELKSGTKRKALNDSNSSANPAADGKKTKRQKKSKTADTANKKRKQRGLPAALPLLTDDQKREYADVHYQERFRLAEKESVISVVASSLAEHDMTMLQLLCKETKNNSVKVRTTETFNPSKTTLVVVAFDPQSKPDNPISRARTLKVMRAVVAGVPIVTPSWITSCLNEGKAIMPSSDMYVRTVPTKTVDPLINSDLGASLLAARFHQAKDQGNAQLLSNVGVLLCGQYNTADGSPRKSDIQSLLRESGATIMTSVGGAMNKLKRVGDNDADKIVLLCDECKHNDRCGIATGLAKEVKAALERDSNGVLIVNSTWLFDSISCGEMVPPKPFQPHSARARDLWKLCSP